MVFWGATRLPLIASRSVSGEVAQKLEDVAWHAKLKQQLASFQSEAKKNLKRDQNDSQTWKVEDKKAKKEKGRKELKSKSEKKRKKKRESSDEEALGHETEMVFNLTSFFLKGGTVWHWSALEIWNLAGRISFSLSFFLSTTC